ncbi:MAG: CapA family protein [Candidatus Kaiserbacteria bacterium]|nr:CapA family protein [Candidatus Kaiserbacteria bacterium]MCB9815957.1 CapA family protein [Candidatus Nomurabacteria bacterium]
MTVRAFFCGILSSILLVQLLSIEIIPIVPSTLHGAIGERLAELEDAIRPSFQPARFVAANDTNADALIFVGDVLLARNVEFLMERNGADYPFSGIHFSDYAVSPMVVGNFESAIPMVHKPTEMLMLNFSVDPQYLTVASKAGFTHFSVANNHSFDFGLHDFENTVSQLEQAQLTAFGHPREFTERSVTFVTIDNTTVALIALHALERKPTQAELTAIFNYANTQSEYQFVYVHWGTEYKETSDTTQQALAKELVEAGADMIVGHHPHVVQEIELIDAVPVFYSLGNYIFDQYADKETVEGLMLHVTLEDTPTVSLLPVTSETTFSQPHGMKQEDHQEFLEELAKKSTPELSTYIQSGVLPLKISVASSSKMAMIERVNS